MTVERSISLRRRFLRRSISGLTLVEVLIAVVVFALGIVPVFLLLTESRRTTVVSLNEIQATGMISSVLDAMKTVPADRIQPLLDQDIEDGGFPGNLSFSGLGIPTAPSHLRRVTRFSIVNQPSLPGERFTNPWGRVLEIMVSVFLKPGVGGTPANSGLDGEKKVLSIKSYRILASGTP